MKSAACSGYIRFYLRSEESIMLCYQLCITCYTAVQINSFLKTISVIKVTAGGAEHSIAIWKQSIHYDSLSAMFNLLHSSMNQDLVEKHLCYYGSHYEINRQFPLHNSSWTNQCPSLCFVHLADSTSVDLVVAHDGFLCNALYVLQYAKRHNLGWSDIEQQKNSISHYQVTLVWRYRAISIKFCYRV